MSTSKQVKSFGGLMDSAPPPPIVVRAHKLAKSFGTRTVLRDVSFSLPEKGHLAILGPGGSGKSTLLKIMLGLVQPDHGQIQIMGKDIFEISRKERLQALRSMGMAFQQGALFDFMTVRENILFAMENMTSFERTFMEDRVNHMLAAVNLPHASNKIPSELSGGMRRRVGIVRALATNPKIAFLDEPTAGLDPVTSRVVVDMIHNLAAQVGSTMVCVTSNVDVAFTFARRVCLLRDGEIVADGTWEELHETDDAWIRHFLDVRGFTPDPEDRP